MPAAKPLVEMVHCFRIPAGQRITDPGLSFAGLLADWRSLGYLLPFLWLGAKRAHLVRVS